jgi:photosystem II stability/assembly factor-like uncharacterized protein
VLTARVERARPEAGFRKRRHVGRRWVSCSASLAALVAPLVGAPSAHANGRYPAADQIVLDPGDPSHLLLRATFGLLQSYDGGQTWSWICEAAVGFTGDPALAVFGGGALLAGYFGSLSTSREQGCGWSAVDLDTAYRYPFDATIDTGDPARAIVVAGSVDGTRSASLVSVAASGVIDAVLPMGEGFVPTTVEVAPSNPSRIYVTGIVENTATLLLRSDDRGRTWERHQVEGYGALPLFISAIDPNDADVVYARIDGGGAAFAQPMTAADDASDHLLVTRDGGATWITAFSLDTDMLGFALSPGGDRIAVGGPGRGVFIASASELAFRPAAPVQVLRCLKWTREALYACGQESLDGWTIGRSLDGGEHFEPLWHQQALTPLECSASSSTGAACSRLWPGIARSIGAAEGAAMATVGADGASPTTPEAQPRESDCSTVGVGRASRGAPTAPLLLLLGLTVAAHRRKVRAPPSPP